MSPRLPQLERWYRMANEGAAGKVEDAQPARA